MTRTEERRLLVRLREFLHSTAQEPWIISRLEREHRLMPPFQNVAAGQTAFLDLPVGFTYDSIHMLYGGTTMNASKMNAVRIIANGQIIWNITGSIRDSLNQYMKIAASSTYKVLTLSFKRHGLKDGADEHTALATGVHCRQCPKPGGVRTLRVEVDIDATAVAPTLACYATVRANDQRLARAVLRVETFTEVVPALANADYLWTHKYNGDPFRPLIHRWSLVAADTEVTKHKLRMDTREIWNRDSKLNEHAQSLENIYSPQSGFVMLDSSSDGFSHPWRLGNLAQFDVVTTHAAGGFNMTVIAESLGVIGG